MSNVTHRSSGVNDAMCCFSSKLQREFSPGDYHRDILSADPRVGLTGVYFFWATSVGAELLFDVIATAYERTSMIVTTNLPFESWTEVLGSERLTGATLDRLTHRCKIIETKGESYRLHDAKARTRRARNQGSLAKNDASQAD